MNTEKTYHQRELPTGWWVGTFATETGTEERYFFAGVFGGDLVAVTPYDDLLGNRLPTEGNIPIMMKREHFFRVPMTFIGAK